MTVQKETFDIGVRLLVSIYGDKVFPPERQAVFWEPFKHLDELTFKRLISSLIAENNSFPPLAKWHGALAVLPRDWKAEAAASQKKYAPCDACGTTGAVFTTRREPPHYETIFRCPCEAGEKLKIPNVRTWTPDAEKEFNLPRLDRGDERAEDNSDPQKAKEWAQKYGDEIKNMLRKSGGLKALPYDTTERIGPAPSPADLKRRTESRKASGLGIDPFFEQMGDELAF